MKLLFAATLLLIAVFGKNEDTTDLVNLFESMAPTLDEVKAQNVQERKMKGEYITSLETVIEQVKGKPCPNDEEANKKCEESKIETVSNIEAEIKEVKAEEIPSAQDQFDQQNKTIDLVKQYVKAKSEDNKEEVEKIQKEMDKQTMENLKMTPEEYKKLQEDAEVMAREMVEAVTIMDSMMNMPMMMDPLMMNPMMMMDPLFMNPIQVDEDDIGYAANLFKQFGEADEDEVEMTEEQSKEALKKLDEIIKEFFKVEETEITEEPKGEKTEDQKIASDIVNDLTEKMIKKNGSTERLMDNKD